ncbi:hypothetical protein OK016_19690 [Vibrio chagasii]|nr:hypothetical protein [Vibrio chagasii]
MFSTNPYHSGFGEQRPCVDGSLQNYFDEAGTNPFETEGLYGTREEANDFREI